MQSRSILYVSVFIAQWLLVSSSMAVSPPLQPASGLASTAYVHDSFTKNSYGSGDTQYWTYEPAAPVPATAPVLLFLHGWSADNPTIYEEMFKHYTRKGYIVVFPKMGGWTNIGSYEANAKTAFSNAIVELQNGSHVAPELSQVIFLGHSLGTQVASRMADTAAGFNYPAPKALVLYEPAGTDQMKNHFALDNNLNNISADTVLVILVRDDWDQDTGAYPVPVTIWHATSHLINRNFMSIKTDIYGNPDLQSLHTSVQTAKANFWDPDQTVDAIDWYGYWRTTEAATNFALLGTDSQYVFGGGNDVTFMGLWSDNTPVTPKQIISNTILENMYLILP